MLSARNSRIIIRIHYNNNNLIIKILYYISRTWYGSGKRYYLDAKFGQHFVQLRTTVHTNHMPKK